MATLMHENGADIRHIQAILGHEDIRTTQIYTQVAIRALQQIHAATHPAEARSATPAAATHGSRARGPAGGAGSRRGGRRRAGQLKEKYSNLTIFFGTASLRKKCSKKLLTGFLEKTAAKRKTAMEGIIVSMATIHISEADAARDFAGLMARVRAGAEIVIESGALPAAVLRAADPPRRSISESIALAKSPPKSWATSRCMDPAFAADLEEIIRNRKPWTRPHGTDPRLSSILIAGERRGERRRHPGARRAVWGDRRRALGCDRRGADARHLPGQDRRRPQAPGPSSKNSSRT